MRTSIISAFIATVSLVAAAPAAEPAKRETNLGGLAPGGGSGSKAANGAADAVQGTVAELFKIGDAILNTPGDAIGKLLSGKPAEAVTGAVGDAMKVAGQLPGDATKIAGDLMGGGANKKQN